MIKSLRTGSLLAVSAVMLFSTYTVFNKVLVANVSPLTLAAVSQGISIFVVILFFGAIPEFKKIIKMPLREVAAIIAIGVLGTVAGPVLFLKGLEHASAVNAILLAELDTVFVPLIAALWLKNKITGHEIGGGILMLGGFYYIFTEGLKIGLDFRLGDIYIALSALCYAFSINTFKKYLHSIPSERVMIIGDTIGVLLLFFAAPTLLFMPHNFAPIFRPEIFKPLLVFSIIAIALARFLWFKAVDLLPAYRATLISLLSPLLALMLAAVVLKEPLSWYHMIGGSLVLVGMSLGVFSELGDSQEKTHQRVKQHV
ncbi:MAG: DMT family transporter [Candidatus Peregrinibacteria bacterium]